MRILPTDKVFLDIISALISYDVLTPAEALTITDTLAEIFGGAARPLIPPPAG